MDRRQFLKFGGFITVSAASGGLAGCGSGAYVEPGLPPASGSGWKFPQSVASGDPRADSILLWTRVVASSLDPVAAVAAGDDVVLRLLVSSEDNSKAIGTPTALAGSLLVNIKVAAQAQYDNTVRHKLTGLQPNTTYYYQFAAGEVRSNVARFKTAPAPGASVAQLQFAYLTCQDWSINHWGALSHIAANENLDFIIHLGDYIYETVGEAFQAGAVETRHDALKLPDGVFKSGSSGAKYASSLADYRYLYKKYRTDTRLQAVHERFAFIAIWDDHEFSDDAWQDAQTYETQAGALDVHAPQRRRNANQAWFEYMPADVSLDTASSGFQNIQIYRDFQFGALMQLVMTDQRLYRADHAIPESSPNPATGLPLGSVGTRYMVAQDIYNGAEAAKIAAASKAGSDPLTLVSMLGNTQRAWWMDKMKSASATWKLWGNEVSLLRMGLNGTDAIATLLALSAVTPLATSIVSTAPLAGGNLRLAAAIVAASTAGAAPAQAQAGAVAVATAAAGGKDTSAQISAAAGGNPAAVAGAAAQVIAFGWIKPDIIAKKAESSFVTGSGKQAALAPYFRRFLLNCDQWDGYNGERKALMAHLKTNSIANVVALTGDIHSFFAGAVHDDYDAAGGGTPVMVDLVSAGVSSDSFFTYLKEASASLGDLGTLVSYPLSLPVPGLGAVNLSVNLLDYTMGKAAPTLDGLLEQVKVQLRGALARSLPEAQLDSTVTALLAGLKADSSFSGQLLPLAQQLAGLGNNPWLKHLNTDAQGYTVVTLTPGKLVAQFKQVNKLVGGAAPATVIARSTTATVTAGTPAVSIG